MDNDWPFLIITILARKKKKIVFLYFVYMFLYILKEEYSEQTLRNSPYKSKIKSNGQLKIQLYCCTLVVPPNSVFNLDVNLRCKDWVLIRGEFLKTLK